MHCMFAGLSIHLATLSCFSWLQDRRVESLLSEEVARSEEIFNRFVTFERMLRDSDHFSVVDLQEEGTEYLEMWSAIQASDLGASGSEHVVERHRDTARGYRRDMIWGRSIFQPPTELLNLGIEESLATNDHLKGRTHLIYIVGGLSFQRGTADESTGRMAEFLFRFLSLQGWNDILPNFVSVEVLPSSSRRHFQSWYAQGSRGTYSALEVLRHHGVGLFYGETMYVAGKATTREQIREDFELLKEHAKIELTSLIQLDECMRPPFMIFLENSSLRTKSVADLGLATQELVARCDASPLCTQDQTKNGCQHEALIQEIKKLDSTFSVVPASPDGGEKDVLGVGSSEGSTLAASQDS